ncbi:MAG: hypothetical protein RJB11_3330 [Planctomycetota bacterium]
MKFENVSESETIYAISSEHEHEHEHEVANIGTEYPTY